MIATWILLGGLAFQEPSPSHPAGGFLESCEASTRDDDRGSTRVGNPKAFAEQQVKEASCEEYINGVADGLEMGGLACFPKGGTLAQRSLTQILKRERVVKYLKDHPKLHHLGRNRLLTDALVAAFPCKPK